MPRTASMDRQAAEDLLGPAEDFVLDSNNRALIRKWAVATGRPSVLVYRMSAVELANLYHAEGPRGNGSLRAIPAPMPPRPAPMSVAAPRPAEDAGAALAELIKRLAEGKGAPVDPEMVRGIVKEELDKQEPREIIRKLEVTTPVSHTVLQGVHYQTEMVIRVASLGHPIMMVGPAGCGKTTIGEHVAKALALPFLITSTVIDTHELLGFVDGHGIYHRTPFREAFENGGVWVADEIDAWDAAALLTANSALANGFVTFPDSTTPVLRNMNFRMIATANTYGHGADRVYIGRNELDAASLDRFATITIDYDTTLEERLCNGNPRWLDRVWKIRAKVNEKNIRAVVSTRAVMMGSAALAIGIEQRDVEAMYLFKGMSKTDREKVLS